jgi:hypothetical protein
VQGANDVLQLEPATATIAGDPWLFAVVGRQTTPWARAASVAAQAPKLVL